MWACAEPDCDDVTHNCALHQCTGCKSLICPGCAEFVGMPICKYCDAFVCLIGRAVQVEPMNPMLKAPGSRERRVSVYEEEPGFHLGPRESAWS